jgi:hypothetical protein
VFLIAADNPPVNYVTCNMINIDIGNPPFIDPVLLKTISNICLILSQGILCCRVFNDKLA